MTVNQVIKHFGSIANTARELKISYQAVHQWERDGAVPQGRQWQIQAMTNGKLVAESAA